jgi:MerR family transcriptional regulator/heat shock protein HspR
VRRTPIGNWQSEIGNEMKRKPKTYTISAVADQYGLHPQTLRLYEREGLLKPSRTEGNTRLYSEEDLEQLETILSLTRDLGVNLAGVEIILNMRGKIEAMQHEVNEFMDYVKRELSRGLGDWEQRLSTALVKSSPTDLVRSAGHASQSHGSAAAPAAASAETIDASPRFAEGKPASPKLQR